MHNACEGWLMLRRPAGQIKRRGPMMHLALVSLPAAECFEICHVIRLRG